MIECKRLFEAEFNLAVTHYSTINLDDICGIGRMIIQ
jgi:hypothetical protein